MASSEPKPVVGWAVAAALLVLAAFAVWLFLGGQPSAPAGRVAASKLAAPAAPKAPLPSASAVLGGSGSIADVAAKVVPSVVNIYSTVAARVPQGRSPFSSDPFFRRFFGQPGRAPQPSRRQQSLGSGVIISPDGMVLTNNHVIEKAEAIRVVLTDQREFPARLIGTDPQSDVAVLRVELEGDTALPALGFGDSSRLRLGDVVLAVGNPFGLGQTVTMGIVSAVGRANVGIADYEDFIQTDAAINPGNSGGALVDMEGNLVGINTAILSRSGGYQGIGFAVPTNMVQPIMDALVKDGRVRRGWLGVVIQDLDRDSAAKLGLGEQRGALIAQVGEGSPAEAAGLRAGDVVVQLNATAIASSAQLRNAVALAGADQEVKMQVLRAGERQELKVLLGELPAELAR